MFCDKPRAAGGDPSVVSAWARKGDGMRTLRLSVGALLVALMLGAVLAVGASATPVARTVATVECQGASATLLMHPGEGGKAIWDISDESVQNAPGYLIKRVEGNVFVSGELGGNARQVARRQERFRRAAHLCVRGAPERLRRVRDIASCAALRSDDKSHPAYLNLSLRARSVGSPCRRCRASGGRARRTRRRRRGDRPTRRLLRRTVPAW
jgi:hypothetical protein